MSRTLKAVILFSIVAILVAFAGLASYDLHVRRLAKASYNVICVDAGVPVMMFTAQEAHLANGSWRLVADGVEYQTNLGCVAKKLP